MNLWNLHGWPGRINDDEGTYVAQAWAMLARGDISHYTYWYDHPFLGWALIAGYAWLTGGFDRVDSAVMVGREFMVITTLVTCVLLFLLSRRLGFGRLATSVAVLVFGLSPLAVHYHRMVFLDNIAAMWVVAALAIAASPRRSLAAALWCAVCMAGAVWTRRPSSSCCRRWSGCWCAHGSRRPAPGTWACSSRPSPCSSRRIRCSRC